MGQTISSLSYSNRQPYSIEPFDPLRISIGSHTFHGTVEELIEGKPWDDDDSSNGDVVVESKAEMDMCSIPNELLAQITDTLREMPGMVELIETAAKLHTINIDADTTQSILEHNESCFTLREN